MRRRYVSTATDEPPSTSEDSRRDGYLPGQTQASVKKYLAVLTVIAEETVSENGQ
jgi:hypothetical protein